MCACRNRNVCLGQVDTDKSIGKQPGRQAGRQVGR